MEELLTHFFAGQTLMILLFIIGFFIYTLGKGADLLVDEAVTLSVNWGVPKILVGATIVSLGTTLPEAAVSVFAAITGSPGLALGNAVGSIICDTGLILGLAAVLSPLPLVQSIVNRQGWIQLGAGVLLVLSCIPYSSIQSVFAEGGVLSQWMGFIFLILLVGYFWISIQCVKRGDRERVSSATAVKTNRSKNMMVLIKLIFGIFLIVVSSRVLIPAVKEMAVRLNVPESTIASTLVAFGTSLPELVTALTAVRKGHGEIALGNVIGADILNVLFVSGAAAAVTKGGLDAPNIFFRFQFPTMIFILFIFRMGIMCSRDYLRRSFGVILLVVYALYTSILYTTC